jgi:phospholipid-binding lipoprotein MlaA
MSAVAGILQGKFDTAGDDLGRVIINTSFGLGGIIDFASDANIPRGNQDFGMVLAHYGVGPRPYLFIPFMGPTTLRDGTGAIAEAFASPTDYILPVRARNTMTGVGAVDAMSKGVKLLEMVDATALDKYTFIRNAYLQARAAKLGDNAYRKADTEEDVDSYFDEGDEDLMNEEPGKTDKPAATTDAVPQAVTPATHGEPELTPQPTPQTAHEPAASPEPTSEVPTSATP